MRSIGVSNFTEAHLTRIIDETGVTPAVNQIELHPYFPQVAACAPCTSGSASAPSRGARSASGRRRSPSPRWPRAAERHGVTPGQVILRWQVQLGAVPIPKSATPERQRQNLDVFGFALAPDEVDAITALGRPDGRLFGGDPDVHEEHVSAGRGCGVWYQTPHSAAPVHGLVPNPALPEPQAAP